MTNTQSIQSCVFFSCITWCGLGGTEEEKSEAKNNTAQNYRGRAEESWPQLGTVMCVYAIGQKQNGVE